MSDTHELHREVDVPPGDVLIHAGDFSVFSKSLRQIEDYNDWLGELPHRWKLVIPGNHEFFLEADRGSRSMLSNATVLIDESVSIGGLKVYGSPMTPLYGGAFGKSSAADRVQHWARVPAGTHVLITHGPPFGILDLSTGQSKRMGDPELLARVSEFVCALLACGCESFTHFGSIDLWLLRLFRLVPRCSLYKVEVVNVDAESFKVSARNLDVYSVYVVAVRAAKLVDTLEDDLCRASSVLRTA